MTGAPKISDQAYGGHVLRGHEGGPSVWVRAGYAVQEDGWRPHQDEFRHDLPVSEANGTLRPHTLEKGQAVRQGVLRAHEAGHGSTRKVQRAHEGLPKRHGRKAARHTIDACLNLWPKSPQRPAEARSVNIRSSLPGEPSLSDVMRP